MEDQFLQFENYLAKQLSDDELKSFEEKLQTDISFKEAFNLYKETHDFLKNKIQNETSTEEFTTNIKKISKNHFKSHNKNKSKNWFISIAASIAVLIGIYVFYPKNTPTYQEYISYPTANFTTRNSQNETLIKAQNTFNTKDFKQANLLFDKLLNEDIHNSELQLFQGITLVELDQFEEADQILSGLSSGKSSYTTNAIWYLALSKLKQEKYSDCKLLLEKLPKEFKHYKNAQKLLKNLPE
ncbi:tetratricopeptide repeat protein [Tenacibaculum sp. 190524A05c]|uniref:tetratricopeptide repeat protein n=1 Tax=Tenacibaculum platacis TaxID=3137852 RepID=UPI0032B238E9